MGKGQTLPGVGHWAWAVGGGTETPKAHGAERHSLGKEHLEEGRLGTGLAG